MLDDHPHNAELAAIRDFLQKEPSAQPVGGGGRQASPDAVRPRPSVLISYSHDSDEHSMRVIRLSERLRSEGVDAEIDRYELAPPQGWPAWMTRQVADRDFILLVCTEIYERRFSGKEAQGKGAGAKWEGGLIRQLLYESEGINTRFIPVVMSRRDLQYIPLELRGTTHHVLEDEAGYEALYRRLTNQPEVVRGALGPLRVLPPIFPLSGLPPASEAEGGSG
jgi:hypothetical protein